MSFNWDPRHFHITFNHNWQSDLMKFPKRLKAGVSKTIEIMCSCIFLLSANSSYSLLIYMSFNCHPCHFILLLIKIENKNREKTESWQKKLKAHPLSKIDSEFTTHTHSMYRSSTHTHTPSVYVSHTHIHSLSLSSTCTYTHTPYICLFHTHTIPLSLSPVFRVRV